MGREFKKRISSKESKQVYTTIKKLKEPKVNDQCNQHKILIPKCPKAIFKPFLKFG
jgi:flavorubredoxin